MRGSSSFSNCICCHTVPESHLIGRLMIPLGTGSVAIMEATLVAYWPGPVTRRVWLLVAACSAMCDGDVSDLFRRNERGL